jgi:serine/threonine protein kinase/Tol biopolymer transport system component
MNSERWRQIKEVLDVSLGMAPGEREEYLTRTCEGDPALREEVESLIEAHEEAGDLFEIPPLPEPADPLLGARIGPYEVVENIGSGGMGAVYRAVRADDVFRKEVAIKVVRRGLDHEQLIRRFRHERQILASLEHPNIASLLDGGTTPDGRPYFVMEYIRGKPIDVFCDENRLSIHEGLELFLAVCAAVQFAHERGVIHRDIKPGNILITRGGIAKLLDFGVAKILNPEIGVSSTDSIMTALRPMTPEYASPEQLHGRPVTAASDVYSLGIVLCELLAGRRPYPQTSPLPQEMVLEIELADPTPPSRLPGVKESQRRQLAGDLDHIVLMAVGREPEKRYPSVGQLAEDIRRHLAGLPVMARGGSLPYRAAKLVQRHKTPAVAVAAAIALSAVLIIATIFWDRGTGSAPPSRITPFTSLVGNETQASFSPDGKKIVFVWSGEDHKNPDIYVKPLAGGAPLRLTSDPAEEVSPAWSPDGTRVAFLRASVNGTSILSVSAAGGPPAWIADICPSRFEAMGRRLDWSPDGKFLAAADKNSPVDPFRIVLIGVSDGRKRAVTIPPEKSIGDVSPAFSPNGKSLAFIRTISRGVNDIYVTRLQGGEPRWVTFDNRHILSLVWTPDGRSIVFSSNRGGGHFLWRVSESGGEPERVPLVSENASDPALSRDGRNLVYSQFFDQSGSDIMVLENYR